MIKIIGQAHIPKAIKYFGQCGDCGDCGAIIECGESDLLPDSVGNRVTDFCHVRCPNCERDRPRGFWARLFGVGHIVQMLPYH